MYLHWCPACEEVHALPDSWRFDGNVENPTFSPSFKHSGYSSHNKPRICHYILTGGILDFCSDSTHALAGKSVPLPAFPENVDEVNYEP
jgi:hypothetical protein